MNGGSNVAGQWLDREQARARAELAAYRAEKEAKVQALDEEPVRSWFPRFAAILCGLLAIGWLAIIAFTLGRKLVSEPVTLEALGATIAISSSPLVLVGVLYLVLVRNSRSEADRLARITTTLRTEQMRLESAIASAADRIREERDDIGTHVAQLTTIGDDAAHRLRSIGETLRTDIETASRHAEALQSATGTARADMQALLTDIPRALAQTRDMTDALETAGLAAHEKAGALDAQIASLVVRGREADEVAGGAAQKLAAHLARIEGVSEAAGSQLVNAAETMTGAIDAALQRAARATDATRQGMEAQGAALVALVEQGQAALTRTGADATESVTRRIADVTGRIEALGALLHEHGVANTRMIDTIETGIERIDTRFAAIDTDADARNARLADTLASMSGHAANLSDALARGSDSADAMIGRAETLFTVLDSVAREVDETLPAALARLNAHSEASLERVSSVAPEVSRIEKQAVAALDRLIEAEGVLANQRASLDAFGAEMAARLNASHGQAETLIAANREQADALIWAIQSAEKQASEMAQGSAAQLVDAMVRVRETAQSAATRAREAIGDVIPQSAQAFAEAVQARLAESTVEHVRNQIDGMAEAAERAVAAANTASDRLMRQMLTIAETSAQVEQRIAEAQAANQESDHDNFARRVALLMESLNSTAIDVTKILSNDVTDSAWAAYLRGDRGVFTRRAVRLLDSGEVREIARHYGDDQEFREQVNRYIHDFEAMLRNILATRDGSVLGVTLLSSDMGKLYVALAQAIERLRI